MNKTQSGNSPGCNTHIFARSVSLTVSFSDVLLAAAIRLYLHSRPPLLFFQQCTHLCYCSFLFSQTSSNQVQDIIESRVEKRTKGVYVPVGGKKMVTFMDDFNMPAKDEFGSQPPLELIKLWLDYGFWYDRQKQLIKYIRVRK